MELIPQLVYSDQVGLVPMSKARDNTTKSISLILAAWTQGTPMLLLSTDAKKAFDRVN